MLLQPTLKAWCWCLASLGPLTIKRGDILSPYCLLWAFEVKRQKCEIMNECLAVYWRFPSTQFNWESAPDAIQASSLKEKRGYFVCFGDGVALLNKTGMFFIFKRLADWFSTSLQRTTHMVSLLLSAEYQTRHLTHETTEELDETPENLHTSQQESGYRITPPLTAGASSGHAFPLHFLPSK